MIRLSPTNNRRPFSAWTVYAAFVVCSLAACSDRLSPAEQSSDSGVIGSTEQALSNATPASGGIYSVHQVQGGRCVRFTGDSAANSTRAVLYACDGTDAQRFQFVVSGSAYALKNLQTGGCMDVAGASTAAGAVVQEYVCHGGTNQQWTPVLFSGTRYYLKNGKSGLVLDASGNGSSNGTGLVQQFAAGKTHQLWTFTSDALTAGDISVAPRSIINEAPAAEFGVNWLSTGTPSQRAWSTMSRFGGDAITTFNFQADAYNSGNDYYFINQALTTGGFSTWESEVDLGATKTGPSLIGIPINARVATNAAKACMFPFTLNGTQQSYEGGCSSGSLCCGNGHTNVSPYPFVMAPTPSQLSAEYTSWTPANAVAFLTAIQARVGATAFGRLVIELDNEPDYWNSTHHDMHPAPVTLTELWSSTVSFASEIKAAFPNIKIAGPAFAYYGNSMVAGYLQNLVGYRTANNVQLVDYLDLHFYPSYGSFSFGNDSQVAPATRIQAARLFYDTTYPNPYDGISPNVYLIPRIKSMMASAGADIGLMLSEYNLGTDASVAGAIAQAESIAVFGANGLSGATRWGVPAAGSVTEAAFLLYAHHGVFGSATKVTAKTTVNPATVTGYGIVNGNTLNVVLINKVTSAKTISLQLGSSLATISGAWQFSQANPTLAAITMGTPSAGLLSVTLPTYSATLIQVPLAF